MTFLEAQRIVANFKGGQPVSFLLAMSGASDALDLFLRAAAARLNRTVEMRTLPYNTLAQTLTRDSMPFEVEVLLLLPWDFVPECDWRSGLPAGVPDRDELCRRASETAALIGARTQARLLYLAAPILPIFPDPSENAALAATMAAHARRLGALMLPPDCFMLSTYLASGCPIAASRLGDVAEAVIRAASGARLEPRKVLITDFDNVLWSGVISEDGLSGIACGPQGAGFRHFLYQSLILALKSEGVLLVGVSRNDPAEAVAPLQSGVTTVKETDFVSILASYHAKSAQIRAIATSLNLGFDGVIFVDDNPVELAEVAAELPDVICLKFPENDEGLPGFFEDLRRHFAREVVTREDLNRTEMYRRRMEGLVPVEAKGADLRAFLKKLDMRLAIHNRAIGSRERAVQLLNKTNQFNINGRRFMDSEIESILENGGRLYGASLTDRTGSHGEVLACLISAAGIVEAFVLSCRVFERRVEHAFLARLASEKNPPKVFRYVATARNEPVNQFLADASFSAMNENLLAFDATSFTVRHQDDLSLFKVVGP